jgi:formylglycine-generating enzyme required for sulfatase activity
MSGNLKEWTDDQPGVDPIYVVRGGSYQSPEFGLTCQTDLSQATGATVLSTLGFRCCDSDGP